MKKREMELMLSGYGLTTAEILYHMPDYNSLLQTFAWQEYDLAPDFPQLNKFLDFWDQKIEASIHSVRYTHRKLISPGSWKTVEGEFQLQ